MTSSRGLPYIYGRSPTNTYGSYGQYGLTKSLAVPNRTGLLSSSGNLYSSHTSPLASPQSGRPVSLRNTSVEMLRVDPMMSMTGSVVSTVEKIDSSTLKFVNKPQFGYHSITGRRPTNEDAHVFMQQQDYQISGVFDGHGGGQVAYCLKNQIPSAFQKQLLVCQDIKAAIEKAVKQVDSDVCRISSYSMIGSTCNIVVNDLKMRKIYFVNTGDSRALIGLKNSFESSFDHKPSAAFEQTRLRRDFPHVVITTAFGIARVNGNLSLSRAVGDQYMKRDGVISDPDIREYSYSENGQVDGQQLLYVVHACDGLWDVLSCQEVDDIMKVLLNLKHPRECRDSVQAGQIFSFFKQKIGGQKAEKAAQCLVNLAFRKGSMDNISCGVAFFVE